MSKTEKIILTFAILALVLSVVGIYRKSSVSQIASSDTLTKIAKKGVIDICYAVYPPAVIKDPNTGELSGHDIDAVELIASRVGAKPHYHEQTFGNMAAALQSGVCDLTTSFFAQIPRAASVAFSNPLFFVGDSGLVRKGDKRFSDIFDADKKGIKVVVANGESGHNFVKERFKNAEIIVIDVESSDLSRFLLEVMAGRADIGVADSNTIRLFAAEHSETVDDVFANKPFNLNPNNYAVRHNDNNFLHFINTAIDYLVTSGEWEKLEKKYDAHWLHQNKEYILK